MSIKETLGLYTYKESQKMFWFQLTGLSLLIWLGCILASFVGVVGTGALVVGVLGGLAPCWVLECAVLTWTAQARANTTGPRHQRLWENQMFILAAVLGLLAQLLYQLQGGVSYALPVTMAGLAIYFIIRIVAPRAGGKSKFLAKEIVQVLLLGMVVCVILARFLASAVSVIAVLRG